MERGTSFIEAMVMLVLSLIVLGGISSALMGGFHQQRKIRGGFRLFQDLDSGRDYLLAEPFDSPLLTTGVHQSQTDFPCEEWIVSDLGTDLKEIVFPYMLNRGPRRFRFFKSRFVQEVCLD